MFSIDPNISRQIGSTLTYQQVLDGEYKQSCYERKELECPLLPETSPVLKRSDPIRVPKKKKEKRDEPEESPPKQPPSEGDFVYLDE